MLFVLLGRGTRMSYMIIEKVFSTFPPLELHKPRCNTLFNAINEALIIYLLLLELIRVVCGRIIENRNVK